MLLIQYYRRSGGLFLQQSDAKLPLGRGYSGTGSGRNNPDLSGVRNVGPIPSGRWLMRADVAASARFAKPVIGLEPLAGTATFGRSGFLVHGDNAAGDASRGCIVLSRGLRQALSGLIAEGHDVLTVV